MLFNIKLVHLGLLILISSLMSGCTTIESSNVPSATQQSLTIEAAVAQRFMQTAEWERQTIATQAIKATLYAAQTATVAPQKTIDAEFNLALTATQSPKQTNAASTLQLSLQKTSTIVSQYNLTGTWVGTLHQPSGGSSTKYKFTMVLKQDGIFVTGTSRIENGNHFGEFQFTGEINNGVINFEEIGLIKVSEVSGYRWCLKKGKLILANTPATSLNGTWSGKTSSASTCGRQSGTLEMQLE